MEVGEGDARSTSGADIFRESPVLSRVAPLPFRRGVRVTWCRLPATCCGLADARLWTVRLGALLGSERDDGAAAEMISSFPSGLSTHK